MAARIIEQLIEIPAEHERNIFGQFDEFPKTVDANIQVFDTNDEEIIERNYKNVVMKRGYIHSVKTTFDLMDIETSFTFEDWTEEDVPR